jgi:hypothetical protein
MSDRAVRRIFNEDLIFLPYKMVMLQAINYQDTVNQKTLCEIPLNALDNDNLNPVLMTGEANFHVCGNVNSQNCQYCTTENPRIIHREPLHSNKVIVWCGVASFGVMGTYFLEDEAGRAVKENSTRHSGMLRTFLELVLQRLVVLKHIFSGFSKTGQWFAMRVLYEIF